MCLCADFTGASVGRPWFMHVLGFDRVAEVVLLMGAFATWLILKLSILKLSVEFCLRSRRGQERPWGSDHRATMEP